jgi:hypothetical protein
MSIQLKLEARLFGRTKSEAETFARQVVALRLACGIDLQEAAGADTATRAKLIARVERAIERERLKGMNRHWSYDLDRHIALRQALDHLKSTTHAPMAASKIEARENTMRYE